MEKLFRKMGSGIYKMTKEEKYIAELEIYDKNSTMVGRVRYFFKVDNSIIANGLVQTVKNSLEKGLFRYYGSDCVKVIGKYKLEEV